jgi:hypothetical protein
MTSLRIHDDTDATEENRITRQTLLCGQASYIGEHDIVWRVYKSKEQWKKKRKSKKEKKKMKEEKGGKPRRQLSRTCVQRTNVQK